MSVESSKKFCGFQLILDADLLSKIVDADGLAVSDGLRAAKPEGRKH